MRAALGLAAAVALAVPVQAEGTLQAGPIWSQIVVFPIPAGFASAFETAREGSYIQEFVRTGETVQDWGQMITVTGAKQFARRTANPVETFAGMLADGYGRACPGSFQATRVDLQGVQGADAVFAGHLSCGDIPGAGHGEAMTFIIAEAGGDVFTLQWAERAEPGSVRLIRGRVWDERLGTLARGLRFCPRVEGEGPPYPSCTG